MIDWKVMNTTFQDYDYDEKVDALELDGQTIGITKNYTYSFYTSLNSYDLEYEEYNFQSLDEDTLSWDQSLVPNLRLNYRVIFTGTFRRVETIFFNDPEFKSIYVHGKATKQGGVGNFLIPNLHLEIRDEDFYFLLEWKILMNLISRERGSNITRNSEC